MCQPCYSDEIMMFSSAVAKQDETLALSYSPGGGNQPADGARVASGGRASMYRVSTDFHGGWYGWGGLQQAIFIAGNFSTAQGPQGDLASAAVGNGSFPDLDMLPLSAEWFDPTSRGWTAEKAARGRTIATLWFMARSPLMHAGPLPRLPVKRR